MRSDRQRPKDARVEGGGADSLLAQNLCGFDRRAFGRSPSEDSDLACSGPVSVTRLASSAGRASEALVLHRDVKFWCVAGVTELVVLDAGGHICAGRARDRHRRDAGFGRARSAGSACPPRCRSASRGSRRFGRLSHCQGDRGVVPGSQRSIATARSYKREKCTRADIPNLRSRGSPRGPSLCAKEKRTREKNLIFCCYGIVNWGKLVAGRHRAYRRPLNCRCIDFRFRDDRYHPY